MSQALLGIMKEAFTKIQIEIHVQIQIQIQIQVIKWTEIICWPPPPTLVTGFDGEMSQVLDHEESFHNLVSRFVVLNFNIKKNTNRIHVLVEY